MSHQPVESGPILCVCADGPHPFASRESFYCGLEECEVKGEATYNANVTKYDCNSIKCACIPGRMLCGENGSVDITDFLAEEIKGPGSFSCKDNGQGCQFTEPAMNQLINDIFGDEMITLQCNSGECLHYSVVPGFTRPAPPDNSKLVAASIAVAGVAVIAACLRGWPLKWIRIVRPFSVLTACSLSLLVSRQSAQASRIGPDPPGWRGG